jgi:predicted nucleic acid-binding protein
VNGKADVIVSGDTELPVFNPFRGIPIVSPAAFVQGASRPEIRQLTAWRLRQ